MLGHTLHVDRVRLGSVHPVQNMLSKMWTWNCGACFPWRVKKNSSSFTSEASPPTVAMCAPKSNR